MVDSRQSKEGKGTRFQGCHDVSVDPGIEIYFAIVGFVGGSFAIIDFIDRNLNQLPSKVRSRILRDILALESDLRFIEAELEHIEEVFSRSIDPESVVIQLGNGYFMPLTDFEEYAHINSQVMNRLRSLSSHIFNLERKLVGVTEVDRMEAGKFVTDARDILTPILSSQDLSLPQARARLNAVIEQISSLCLSIRQRIE